MFKKSNYVLDPNKPSSEEVFIQKYLEDNGIKFIREYKIINLKDDTKNFRRVDFYLPKLGVYVEYFGMYNSTKKIRESYDEKVRVYLKNNLGSVILYPHELGVLDYAFHGKILKVLRKPKFKNNFTTFRYKWSRYFSIGRGYYFFLFIISLVLSMLFLGESGGEGETNVDFVLYVVLWGVSWLFFLLFINRILRVFYYDD